MQWLQYNPSACLQFNLKLMLRSPVLWEAREFPRLKDCLLLVLDQLLKIGMELRRTLHCNFIQLFHNQVQTFLGLGSTEMLLCIVKNSVPKGVGQGRSCRTHIRGKHMKHDLLLWSVCIEEEQLCLTNVSVVDDTAARLNGFSSTH